MRGKSLPVLRQRKAALPRSSSGYPSDNNRRRFPTVTTLPLKSPTISVIPDSIVNDEAAFSGMRFLAGTMANNHHYPPEKVRVIRLDVQNNFERREKDGELFVYSRAWLKKVSLPPTRDVPPVHQISAERNGGSFFALAKE